MSNSPILSILKLERPTQWPRQAIDAGLRDKWNRSGFNELRVIEELEAPACGSTEHRAPVTWLDLAAYQIRHQQ